MTTIGTLCDFIAQRTVKTGQDRRLQQETLDAVLLSLEYFVSQKACNILMFTGETAEKRIADTRSPRSNRCKLQACNPSFGLVVQEIDLLWPYRNVRVKSKEFPRFIL